MTKKRKKTVRKKAVKITLFLLIMLMVASVVAVGSAATFYYARADIRALQTADRMATVIYDRYGDRYVELTNSRIEYVPITRIPESLQQAIIAIEDVRFREHLGIDLVGIGRAAVQNVIRGGITQGGSTITQQLAKNQFLSAERTYTRKFKEAVIAVKIDRHYSKDQILELYLNTIYFGDGTWGVQNAAQNYFGKPVGDLSLAESALLAGLPKAPSHYSPRNDVQKAKERRDLVLQKMYEYEMITSHQLTQALQEEIRLADTGANEVKTRFSSYTDHVIEEAIRKSGLTEQEILSGGLQIYTELDPKMQAAAEYVYRRAEYFPEDRGGLESGIVLLNSRSGGVRALVGQIGEKTSYRGFNYATHTERQPGSSIKPIVAYAPALQQGYRPTDYIHDVPTDFGNYTPANYGGRFHGWVTLEESLVQSYNVPAVALLREIGIDNGMALARAAGLPLTEEDRTLAVALGGLNRGVSPLDMAQAYTMFANDGIRSEAYAIKEIFDSRGNRLYQAHVQQEELLTPATAYEITLMLEQVVQRGTGTGARMSRPLAGKTGTTQLPDTAEFRNADGSRIEGTRDAWFVGYTPDVVGAVWLGYPDTDRERYLTTTGGRFPAQIFKEVMERALDGEPVQAFTPPSGYVRPAASTKYVNGTPPLRTEEQQDDDLPEDEEEFSELDDMEIDEENGVDDHNALDGEEEVDPDADDSEAGDPEDPDNTEDRGNLDDRFDERDEEGRFSGDERQGEEAVDEDRVDTGADEPDGLDETDRRSRSDDEDERGSRDRSDHEEAADDEGQDDDSYGQHEEVEQDLYGERNFMR